MFLPKNSVPFEGLYSSNENFSNERKNLRKIKGCTYKISNVSPTMCSSVSNLVPMLSNCIHFSSIFLKFKLILILYKLDNSYIFPLGETGMHRLKLSIMF